MAKERITVSVDSEVAAQAREAAPESLSSWVAEAITEKVANDRRMAALREAVAAYEAEFGVITDEEMAEQRRIDQANAVRTGRGSTAGAA